MSRHEVTTLAGGCFWCLEAAFQQLKGVEHVQSGYAGGHVPNPSYEDVCTGTTGHAEVVQISFDPAVVSFDELLHVFFTIHDPTTLNRQGGDVGTQYRSAIFYHSPEQEATAERVMAELRAGKVWDDPIVSVLPGRGVPPRLFPPQPQPGLLQRGDRAQGGQGPQALSRQVEAADGLNGLQT